MEIDLVVRVVPLLATAVTIGTAFWNVGQGRRKGIADEYASRRQFYDDLKDPELAPDLKELGYQMVAGNRSLTSREVKHLLEVDPTGKALGDYIEGRAVLQCSPPGQGLEISLKPSYQKKFKRRAWQTFYFMGYLMSFINAFIPLAAPSAGVFGSMGMDTLSAVTMGCFTFLPVSYLALREGRKIAKAEKLIEVLNHSLRARLTPEDEHRKIVSLSRQSSL